MILQSVIFPAVATILISICLVWLVIAQKSQNAGFLYSASALLPGIVIPWVCFIAIGSITLI